MPKHRHVIAMVCDFFYPRHGGVEMHIWSLSQCLMRRGHKVIVITHSYGRRKGIRYMTNGLKVYYTPMVPFVDQNSLPTTASMFPLLRTILLREKVTIVHGHQATSVMTHEALIQARTMGYKTCYTGKHVGDLMQQSIQACCLLLIDHSLFGFADAASIHVNKVLRFTLSDVHHAICVSHTCRENLVLRAALLPENVSTIPNAVDTSKFLPDPSARNPPDKINIVIISRLVYRKGIDLVAELIPRVLQRFHNVHFIIGGDGPKRLLLEEMIERNHIHDRVELLGAVPHTNVRDVLVRGHIFLNSSLTESFCIAIVEAASCGLYVVSTRVGGVPEVLPPEMIDFAPTADVDGLLHAIAEGVRTCQTPDFDPIAIHERVASMYDWRDVAARTERVYDGVSSTPDRGFLGSLARYRRLGVVAGILAVVHMTAMFLVWRLLEWYAPAADVEVAVDFPVERYLREKKAALHEVDEKVVK